MILKAATYNVWSGRNNVENQTRSYDWTADVIAEISPDIIGLQEVSKQPILNFPPYDIEEEVVDYLGRKTGMYAYFAPARKKNGIFGFGNGILSRYPIRNAETVMIPDDNPENERRCVLRAELDVCGGITVLVTHFGLTPEEHRCGVKTVLSLAEKSAYPVIFMGDLNVTPENEALKPIFKRLTDTANGAAQPHTWPSAFTSHVGITEEKYGMNKLRKVDYIFTTPHFRTLHSGTHPSLASDHLPFAADLEFQN